MAAAAPAFVAVQFILAMQAEEYPFVAQRDWLQWMMTLEDLIFISIPVLLFGLWMLWAAETRAAKTRWAFLIAGFYLFYGFISARGDPARWMAYFAATVVLYAGPIFVITSGTMWLVFTVRWLLSWLVFTLALLAAGVPDNRTLWIGNWSVLEAGAAYFSALALLECSALYTHGLPALANRLRG